MRCQICDYGLGTSSLFRESTTYGHSSDDRVAYSRKHKMFLCTPCRHVESYDDEEEVWDFAPFGDLVDNDEQDNRI